jgi:hypothetical protein
MRRFKTVEISCIMVFALAVVVGMTVSGPGADAGSSAQTAGVSGFTTTDG